MYAPESLAILLPFVALYTAVLIRVLAPALLPRHSLACGALAVVALGALATGVLAPAGVAVTVVLFLAAAAAGDSLSAHRPDWTRWLGVGILVATAAVLMLHVAPGFDNPMIYRDLQLSAQSIPFDLYWNLDKGLVGLAFVLYIVPVARLGGVDRRTLAWSTGASAVLAVTLLLAATAAGLLAWDPKLSAALLWWAPANLLITSVTEEAVFRGFLQERLSQWLGARWRHGDLLAVAIAAALFGVAHIAGGIEYVVLSAVAGVGYGIAYRHGGGLLAATLAHFLLNTAHIVFLTYPWHAA